MLTALAPAKVNLFLHVGPAKTNGRHDLDSLVMFADSRAADVIGITPASDLSLAITGGGAKALAAENDNLVLRAARELQRAANVQDGAAITLEKSLPIAAGIGGGSADAAATLRLLTKIWKIDPSHAEHLAPTLGGDVPVALLGETAFMRGEGERVERAAQLPALHAVLVNPNVPCPTRDVFEAFDMAGDADDLAETIPPTGDLAASDLIDWLDEQRNALVGPAIGLAPEIADVLGALADTDGARLTRMSGSGATCFALYDTADDTAAAAMKLSAVHPGWWVRATVLGTGGTQP